MSQNYTLLISGVTTFGQMYGIINSNTEALRSEFSGTVFPSSPTVGQRCWRTDISPAQGGTPYLYTGVSSLGTNGWVTSGDVDPVVKAISSEIQTARGTQASLDTRLSISINPDGTLKAYAPVGDWWMNEPDTITYVSPTSFTVGGDKTVIYEVGRSVEITQTSGVEYGFVESTTYNSGPNNTTIVVKGVVVDSGISAVQYGQPVYNAPEDIYSLKIENDLSDLASASNARFNLDVYSTTEVDNAIASIVVDSKNVPPQAIAVAPLGDRPIGLDAANCDAPVISMTESSGVVTISSGIQVSYSESGSVYLSEISTSSQDIDFSAESDGTYYIASNINTDGSFSTPTYTSIPPENATQRIGYLTLSTLSLYSSSGVTNPQNAIDGSIATTANVTVGTGFLIIDKVDIGPSVLTLLCNDSFSNVFEISYSLNGVDFTISGNVTVPTNTVTTYKVPHSSRYIKYRAVSGTNPLIRETTISTYLSSDFYNTATGEHFDSNNVNIRRVYLGYIVKSGGVITDVICYALGDKVRIPATATILDNPFGGWQVFATQGTTVLTTTPYSISGITVNNTPVLVRR